MINLIASLHIPEGSGLKYLIYGLLRWIYNGIGSYGWAIIVFTILLRLIVLPLDFGNKYFTKKNAVKMAEFKDQDAELKKQFAEDPMKYMTARRQMFRQNGYNPMGSSLFMLTNVVLTLFIFITVFQCLSTVSSTNLNRQYKELGAVYIQYSQGENLDIESSAFREQINKTYGECNESFLWIHNIFRPDTWTSKKSSFSEFYSATKNMDLPIDEDAIIAGIDEEAVIAKLKANASAETKIKAIAKAKTDAIAEAKIEYIREMHKTVNANLVGDNKDGWNGYFILVIGSAVTMYFSTKVTMATQQKQKTEDTKKEIEVGYSLRKAKESERPSDIPQVDPEQIQKVMKFILPGIMVIFTFTSTAAFALYITAGAIIQTTFGIVINNLVGKILQKQQDAQNANKPKHPVINPHSRYFKKQYE